MVSLDAAEDLEGRLDGEGAPIGRTHATLELIHDGLREDADEDMRAHPRLEMMPHGAELDEALQVAEVMLDASERFVPVLLVNATA